MKIIDNKRRDYYDSAQGFGYEADDPVVYVREPKTIQTDRRGVKTIKPQAAIKHATFVYVGFCGKIYPAINVAGDGIDHQYVYKAEQAVGKLHREALSRLSLNYDWRERFRQRTTEEMTRHYFEHIKDDFAAKLCGYFREYNCPVFCWSNPPYGGGVTLVVNPLLRPLDFFNCPKPDGTENWHAHAVWQEIEAYVGGVLNAKVNPIPDVSDEIRAELHGFDAASFRSEKSDEPKRRKHRRKQEKTG